MRCCSGYLEILCMCLLYGAGRFIFLLVVYVNCWNVKIITGILFISFARISYVRFIAMRSSTYIQEPLVIGGV
jgi:hypothetical protein